LEGPIFHFRDYGRKDKNNVPLRTSLSSPKKNPISERPLPFFVDRMTRALSKHWSGG